MMACLRLYPGLLMYYSQIRDSKSTVSLFICWFCLSLISGFCLRSVKFPSYDRRTLCGHIRKEELSKTSTLITSCPVSLPSEAIAQNTPWYSIIFLLQILTPFTIISQMITHTCLCPSTTAQWIFVKLADQLSGVWLLFLSVILETPSPHWSAHTLCFRVHTLSCENP